MLAVALAIKNWFQLQILVGTFHEVLEMLVSTCLVVLSSFCKCLGISTRILFEVHFCWGDVICKGRVVGVCFLLLCQMFGITFREWFTKMCGYQKRSPGRYQRCYLYSGILTEKECSMVGWTMAKSHRKSIITYVNPTKILASWASIPGYIYYPASSAKNMLEGNFHKVMK